MLFTLLFTFLSKVLLTKKADLDGTPNVDLLSLGYRISGNFCVGLIFAEFATSLKSPNIDTAKNTPFFTSSLSVLEIVKIRLSENLTHLPGVIFAKISRREKFPITVYDLCNFNKTWILVQYYISHLFSYCFIECLKEYQVVYGCTLNAVKYCQS